MAAEFTPDRWLSSLFDRPVLQIRGGDTPAAELARSLVSHAAQQPAAFYFAKVDVSDVATVAALSAAGMTVVDVNVIFSADPRSIARAGEQVGDAIDIRPMPAGSREAVLTIAGTGFRYSRFHLDPHVPDRIANAIKREWIASYYDGRRGEQLWVAFADGYPSGFLAVIGGMNGKVRHKTIDLIAVDERMRGRGIGRALVNFFLQRYAPDCDQLRVGTQIANRPSIRLYERAGMAIDSAQFVLHMHVPDSRDLR